MYENVFTYCRLGQAVNVFRICVLWTEHKNEGFAKSSLPSARRRSPWRSGTMRWNILIGDSHAGYTVEKAKDTLINSLSNAKGNG